MWSTCILFNNVNSNDIIIIFVFDLPTLAVHGTPKVPPPQPQSWSVASQGSPVLQPRTSHRYSTVMR